MHISNHIKQELSNYVGTYYMQHQYAFATR